MRWDDISITIIIVDHFYFNNQYIGLSLAFEWKYESIELRDKLNKKKRNENKIDTSLLPMLSFNSPPGLFEISYFFMTWIILNLNKQVMFIFSFPVMILSRFRGDFSLLLYQTLYFFIYFNDIYIKLMFLMAKLKITDY